MREDALLRHYAERRRFLVKGVDPKWGETLFCWKAFQALVGSGHLPASKIKVIRDRKLVSQVMYCNRGTDELNPVAVLALCRQGATVIVDFIHELVPAIEQIVENLRACFGSVDGANLYVTGGAFQGFARHHDPHDVLAVQLLGAKRWQGFGSIATPTGPDEADKDYASRPLLWEEVVSAGDVFYLPRGEVHCAIPVETPSMHLTFSIEAKLRS
jgi:JmjC domain